MASVRGGGARRSNDPVIRDFEPSSDWTEDSNAHYLLVDLPGTYLYMLNLCIHISINEFVSFLMVDMLQTSKRRK